MSRRPKREHRVRRWPIWAAATGLAVAVLLVAGATTSTTGKKRQRRAAAAQPASVELLRASLQRVDRSLTPADQAMVYQEIRADLERLTPAIIWVLNQPEQELFGDTAALAAQLAVTVAVPPLKDAAWDPSSPERRTALVALDRLEPISTDDTALLLLSQETELELAAVLLLGARRQAAEGKGTPFALATELGEPVLALLSHPDLRVRDAAFAAVPDELPAAMIEPVLDQLDDELGGPLAVQLLDRLDVTDEVASVLARRLALAEPARQLLLLGTIDRYASTEPVREVLWDITDTDTDLAVRTAALACIERSSDRGELPPGAQFWPAPLRYQAARIRLRAGHLDGVDTLLQLAEDADSQDEQVRAAAGQSRVLLGRLAKIPPHSDMAQFALWRAGLQRAPTEGLPAVPGR